MFLRASKNSLTQLLAHKRSGSYELNPAKEANKGEKNEKSASSVELSDIVAGADDEQTVRLAAGKVSYLYLYPAPISTSVKPATTTTRATVNSKKKNFNKSSNLDQTNWPNGEEEDSKQVELNQQRSSNKLFELPHSLSHSLSSLPLSSSANYLSGSSDQFESPRASSSLGIESLEQAQQQYNNQTLSSRNNNNDFSVPNRNHSFHDHYYVNQDGVTLCTLGVGTTFGASVIPGKSHSVSVVTSDDCTLLRVRRADFQEIFNEQSHLINNVESSPFCSFTSLNRFTASNAVSKRTIRPTAANEPLGARNGVEPAANSASRPLLGSKDSLGQQDQHKTSSSANACALDEPEPEPEPEQQDGELADFNLDSIDSNELSSHLMRIGWVLRTLMLDQCPHLIQNRRIYPLQLHKHHAHHHAHQHRHSQWARLSPSVSSGLGQGSSSAGLSSTSTGTTAPLGATKQKHLVSMASSSQLLSNSGSSSSSSTKSAASAAGRKVANYVASSFMRANSKATAAAAAAALAVSGQQQLSGSSLDKTRNNSKPAHALFTSSSFDAANSGQIEAQTNYLASGQASSSVAGQGSNYATGNLNEEPVLFRRSMLGREMVDWLVNLSQAAHTNASRFVTSRLQAISMWQVLLEQGIVFSYTGAAQQQAELSSTSSTASVASSSQSLATLGAGQSGAVKWQPSAATTKQHCCQFQFCDDQHAYYKFWFDRDGTKQQQTGSGSSLQSGQLETQTSNSTSTNNELLPKPSESDLAMANESLWWSLKVLSKMAPDACFRLILSKPPNERSAEEVDIVYEELQHLKALSHLTNSVKKELAACVTSEHHAKQNTVIFNQGDVGDSWYIILRGSVNVVIVGKGVVCTLHDGDDFGKLALVNDAPRAATIVTNESNCYFLRVDKHNFNTILRDVEANTVRLKEHGK